MTKLINKSPTHIEVEINSWVGPINSGEHGYYTKQKYLWDRKLLTNYASIEFLRRHDFLKYKIA